ncbi:adenylyltransferase/cytidyltransferase family protein [Lactiplantibacillus plantarum]|jgi:glycerol-3-phosphate cytidylyltransferase|uniref:adenylyltransferase/cytidyltransferase family protein n=1 Tax=Lactiplantibacillus plantarum TaxID=1590 RepID=UPI002237C3D4|nr:adenylyltransferase/cytidyltransferase family protein [Lactiplantibacillus plantarum]MCW6140242.1 adenylyltransferase/cytidyltransferase family protein [Lactiplantibacillus plantarum]
MIKKYKRGYTQGVFDMFHVGHLNLINNAKAQCDYLVVGVNVDDLVKKYKSKKPVIDETIIAQTLDKKAQLDLVGFDAIFIGDDWKGSARWSETEVELKKYGVDVVYLPRTEGISSTNLRVVKDERISE